MKIKGTDRDAQFWKVIDLDSGELISHVIEADDETGEYVARVYDDDGCPVRGADGGLELRRMTGRIRLIHDDMSNHVGIS